MLPTTASARAAAKRTPPDEATSSSWIREGIQKAQQDSMNWYCFIFPRDEKQKAWFSGVRGADKATKHPSHAYTTKSHMANGVYGKNVEVKPVLYHEEGDDGQLYTHLYFRINPNFTINTEE